MTWLAVARKDVNDAARSKAVWGLTGLFAVVFLGIALALPRFGEAEFEDFVAVAVAIVRLLVPLIAIVVGYKSVIGERQTGSIALLLSLPHSRRDVAVGKYLGRSAVLGGPLLAALVLAVPLVFGFYDGVEPVGLLGFIGATVLYGLAFLGLVVGCSLATTSSRRLEVATFGAYVAFVLLWSGLVDFLTLLVFRFQGDPLSDPPAWALLGKLAEPTTAYRYLLADGLGIGSSVPVLHLDSQWYASPIVALAILFAWMVVPVALGYWRFRRSDL